MTADLHLPTPPILNLMLGKKRGGLEQAALDYAEALAHAGIRALTVISPGAWVEAPLVAARVTHESLPNHARWDMLAVWRLRRLAKRTGARAIICHGNRALTLALIALKGRIPVIAVTHNYATRRCARADACFAITTHLAEHLRAAGVTAITAMPNMVRPHTPAPRPPFRHPPVIGSMGRFVMKKGFDTYLHALAIVKAQGVAFRAILGGEGERADALSAYIEHYSLESHVELRGWVKDKNAFFEEIDLFVLPSLHEPFGIVLLEAMTHGVPVITSDAEGPREIVRHGVDAIVTPRGDAQALAEAIITMLDDEAQARALAEAAQQHVAQHYSLAAMATRLQTALAPYITPHE
ncbi:MAG: glycosyltransferase [Pseudomonadota bacterium]